MRKFLTLFLVVVLAASAFSGCKANSETPDSGASTPAVSEEKKEVVLSDVVQKVKDAYGENYVPSMVIDEQMLVDLYSINIDDVDEFIGEMPMMSAHVDTFIAIKATEGKGDAIETALNDYREYVVSSAMQYPSNIEKVKASQVVRHGDYVFFVMLGAFDDNLDASEADQAKFAQEQCQIGVDAINSCFA